MNKQLIEFTDYIAKNFSKDSSTKVASIIMDEEGLVPISHGYNGMPRGVDETIKERQERPEKYFWYEHAERNALYNSARSAMMNKMILSSGNINMESARAIVSSGIDTVVLSEQNHEEIERVLSLFKETKTNVIYVNQKNTPLKIKKYYNLAKKYGEMFSKDKNNKSGCIILDKETFEPKAYGAYTYPVNIEKEIKKNGLQNDIDWFQEAEKNAIFNAIRKNLKNCRAYVSWCPCKKCAAALITSGIKKVITKSPDYSIGADERWRKEFEKSLDMFNVANIEVDFIENEVSNDYVLIEKNKLLKTKNNKINIYSLFKENKKIISNIKELNYGNFSKAFDKIFVGNSIEIGSGYSFVGISNKTNLYAEYGDMGFCFFVDKDFEKTKENTKDIEFLLEKLLHNFKRCHEEIKLKNKGLNNK